MRTIERKCGCNLSQVGLRESATPAHASGTLDLWRAHCCPHPPRNAIPNNICRPLPTNSPTHAVHTCALVATLWKRLVCPTPQNNPQAGHGLQIRPPRTQRWIFHPRIHCRAKGRRITSAEMRYHGLLRHSWPRGEEGSLHRFGDQEGVQETESVDTSG